MAAFALTIAAGNLFAGDGQSDRTFAELRAAKQAELEAFKAAIAGPFRLPEDHGFAAFELQEIRANIPHGSDIGDRIPPGLLGLCTLRGPDDMLFTVERDLLDAIDLHEAFHREMAAAGFTLGKDPSALFRDEEAENRADFLLGAEIVAMDFQVCDSLSVLNPFAADDGKQLGSLKMEIVWHVFDKRARQVVEKLPITGRALEEDSVAHADIRLLRAAFVDAARHLGSAPAFQDLLRKGSGSASRVIVAGAQERRWRIPALPLSARKGEAAAAFAVDGTVTILTGTGHGSGFFISEDGLLLTNHHVVGGADEVTLRLPNSVEIAGDVLAHHKGRDVALLRAGLRSAPALPLRVRLPDVGETVLTIGTPIHDALDGTLRRGVVSAMREHDEQIWIQSDAGADPGNSGGPLIDERGNVVGITSRGVTSFSGDSTGLNLFIPIGEALEVLGISLDQEGGQQAASP